MLHHRFYDWLTRNQTFVVEWAPLLANTHPTLTSNEGKFFHIDLWLPFYISWCIQVTDQAARLKAKYFVLYRWIQWTFITSSKSNWFGTIPISKCTTTFYRTEQTCDSQLMHDLKKECFKNTNEFRCVYKTDRCTYRVYFQRDNCFGYISFAWMPFLCLSIFFLIFMNTWDYQTLPARKNVNTDR